MILPTPEFDPLFADDGIPFREKMLAYIEREFSDMLGERRLLLRTDTGLAWLAEQAHQKPSPPRCLSTTERPTRVLS